jgi:esterase/lipase superfamily enzyme
MSEGRAVKQADRWYSERLGMEAGLVRWGHYGTPVLMLPTAGGDAEEIERMGVVEACGSLLEEGRVKLYSCDSLAGQAMVERWGTVEQRMRLLDAFHAYIRFEVVPAIASDSGGDAAPPIITIGASIGAFNAVALLCRYPEAFRAAVGMSGTYDLQRFYDDRFSDELYHSSPLHFLPGLEGEQLDRLRERFVVLASGEGAWENIAESWRLADVLGSKGVPNRVDAWGSDWAHDWPTWRRQVPQYLDELA